MGSLALDPAGLGSPFHTPTTTRFYTTATPASASASASASVASPAVAAAAGADHASPTATTSVVRRLFRTPLVPSVLLNTSHHHHSRKTSLSKSLSAKELQFASDQSSDPDPETPMAPLATFTDLPVEVSQPLDPP